MSKQIIYGEEARKVLKAGVDAVANAVRTTIGPKGRNVVFDRGFGGPTITNDGVTIAREVVLKDPLQNMGANIIKEAAQKTNDVAGDGTTTSVILTQAIVAEGMRRIDMGVNAIAVKNGIEKAVKVAVDSLKKMAKPLTTDEETLQVATISAESPEIGKIITDAIKKLGKEAVITVEESPLVGVTSEVSQGMEFEKGFISHYMITDLERAEAEYKDVPILVTDMKLGSIQEIVPFLEEVMKTAKRELVVIADDIVGEVLSTFVVNKLKGNLFVLGIKSPGFGERKKDYLQDIATLTGATIISADTGMTLSKILMTDLGHADKVVSTKDKTIIIGGKGDPKAIKARIVMVQNELAKLDSTHDKLKVEERIAKLSGGVAVIKVGAETEMATRYLKFKVEDAVAAVKAALEEGIVAGGGTALIRASEAVMKGKFDGITNDEEIGFEILVNSMSAPLRYIVQNCGLGEEGALIVAKVKEMAGNGGYDALEDVYKDDMVVSGIIDPVKVTRSALENAASAASILLTLECAMSEEPRVLPDEK